MKLICKPDYNNDAEDWYLFRDDGSFELISSTNYDEDGSQGVLSSRNALETLAAALGITVEIDE